jgi:hypothetical protein
MLLLGCDHIKEAKMGEMRNGYKILIWETEDRPFGRLGVDGRVVLSSL